MKLTVIAASGLVLAGTAGLLAGLGACGGDETTSNGGGGQTTTSHTTSQGGGGSAQGGGGAAQGGGGAAQGGGGAAQGGGGAGQGGGPAICGGIAGIGCEATDFCNYQPSQCGGDDSTGVCESRPVDCSDIYLPVCACDGTVYGNDCQAMAAGVDINVLGCEPPEVGLFACGAGFCSLAAEYCQRTTSDVSGWDDDFGCVALPVGCGDVPSCDCLAAEACGNACTGVPDTGLMLTCPGG